MAATNRFDILAGCIHTDFLEEPPQEKILFYDDKE